MRDDTLEQHQRSVALFSFLLYDTCHCFVCGIGERCFFLFKSSDSPETWVRDSQSEMIAQRSGSEIAQMNERD
jgi:hypothetical protein